MGRGDNRLNLRGRIFGGLTAIEPGETLIYKRSWRTRWHCRCICGQERLFYTSNLLSGAVLSCGCRSRAVFTGSKLCRSCGIEKLFDEYDISASGRIRNRCKICAALKDEENIRRIKRTQPGIGEKYRKTVRAKAIQALGAKCRCCGEDEFVFLVVDHVNGGGSVEERKIGTYGIYRRVLTDPLAVDHYQVLCHNCNWAKYNTGGNCPHNEPSWMPPTFGGFTMVCG